MRSADTRRDRHLTPDCTPRVSACILSVSSGFTESLKKYALGKNPLRSLPVRPAPAARAGPEGLHSQPVLPNAYRPFSRDWTVEVQALAGWLPVILQIAAVR